MFCSTMAPSSHSSKPAQSDRQGRSQAARRRYWTEQMEAAHGFMQRLQAHPVAECGEPMQALEPAADEAGIRIEFPAGLKLGELQRVFALRASLVPRLLAVAAAMLRQGWVLRLEDAYRSLAVQDRKSVV